jgi:2-polyprenyl-3-methyl-5-hydroxy-6-metoxy-1,4-benzoquinol methylase
MGSFDWSDQLEFLENVSDEERK